MTIRPNPHVVGTPYTVPRASAPTDLKLDTNVGLGPGLDALAAVGDAAAIRHYPSARALEARLAARHGVDPEQVLVTSGGDDALDRLARLVCAPGRETIFPVPGFSVIVRYATACGAEVIEVPWEEGPYPTEAVLAAATPATSWVVLTSPNNPTGNVATADDVRRLCEGLPDALVLVDLAYAEFADVDLTDVALEHDNAVVVRSFSKAWGLAGLRVGYAMGSPEVIGWLRSIGLPYAVSGVSLALVDRRLDEEAAVHETIETVKAEREELAAVLTELHAQPQPSQANFVLARVADPDWARDGLAGLGIAVRTWPGHSLLGDRVRIACPGNARDQARLVAGLRAVLGPDVLLLDVDGVIADVSRSYRRAIVATAAAFGVHLTGDDVADAKAAGNANNDWVLTQRMLRERGVEVRLEEVTQTFQRAYNGGLWRKETLIPRLETLQAIGRRWRIGLVTGRPRAELDRFLDHMDLRDLAEVSVCMEDAPAKPDPAPVRLALKQLGQERGWMVGDTVDDIRAARAAGVVPFGVLTPADRADPQRAARTTATLTAAGAARVLTSLEELP